MALVIVFAAVLGFLVPSISLEKVCSTKECVRVAEQYLLNMDTSVDPCDNFYKFACGKYVANNPSMPKDDSEVSEYTKLRNLIYKQLFEILEEPIQKTDAKFLLDMKKFYETSRSRHSNHPAVINGPDINELVGGWPVVEDAKPDIGWETVLYHIQFVTSLVGKNVLMTLFVDTNLKNSTERILNIRSPVFDEAFYTSDETIKANYRDAMVRLAIRQGADKKVAKVDMQLVWEFANDLAKNSKSTKKIYADKKASDNLYTIKQLEIEFPGFPWTSFMKKFAPKSLNISSDSIINLYEPEYIKSLVHILKKTPTRVIRNYLMWKIVNDFWPYSRNFKNSHCLENMYPRYKPLLSALYIHKYINQDSRSKALELVTYIKDQLEQTFKETNWPQKDKAKAIEKLNSLYAHVRFPDEFLTEEVLFHSSYEDIKEYDQYILEITENKRIFKLNTVSSSLYAPIDKSNTVDDKSNWTDFSNLMMTIGRNENKCSPFDISIAYLQGNFFNASFPGYINFAAIGHTIAHVMSHGYDNRGRKYDEYGAYEEQFSEAEQDFAEKKNCIINQFNNVSIFGEKIKGKFAVENIIADLRGLKTSYLSYQNWKLRHNEQPGLPGLNYTDNQLFWLAFGSTLCNHKKEEAIIDELRDYAPNEFRVNGPASNLEMFSKDFNCPTGSNMNPIKKCTPW